MNLKPVFLAITVLSCAGMAEANLVTFTGDTTGGPTFNRPNIPLNGTLSADGTAVPYDVYTFSVSVTGTYSFLTTALFDSVTYLALAAPLSSALVASDDLFTQYFGASGFDFSLTADTPYIYVTTGYVNDSYGQFSTTIGGQGNITEIRSLGAIGAVSAVPEPASWALLSLGMGALGLARRRRESMN